MLSFIINLLLHLILSIQSFVSLLVTPSRNCRLKLLKLERIKDYLLMEEEFIQNQERLKPQEEKHEVSLINLIISIF